MRLIVRSGRHSATGTKMIPLIVLKGWITVSCKPLAAKSESILVLALEDLTPSTTAGIAKGHRNKAPTQYAVARPTVDLFRFSKAANTP